jgi:hypothetical protein
MDNLLRDLFLLSIKENYYVEKARYSQGFSRMNIKLAK